MVLAYSGYSELVMMSLRFKIFRKETANCQMYEKGKCGQRVYTIVQDLVTLQHVCGYNYA